MARSPSPADGHHYAPERPQREAAGYLRHSHNSVPDDLEPDPCVSVVASLREEFASRFARIKPLAADFKLFTAPFEFPWTTPLQMELVELQCNDDLKAKFYNSSPLSFFRDIALPSRNFPKFIAHVWRHLLLLCKVISVKCVNKVHMYVLMKAVFSIIHFLHRYCVQTVFSRLFLHRYI